MGEQDQELRLTAKTAGFEQAAGQVDKVTDAEKDAASASEALAAANAKLASVQDRLAKAMAGGTVGEVKALKAELADAKTEVDGLSVEQEKLGTSTETLTSLLSRIHPALGAMADAMFKGSKLAGDLANKQLDLKGITEKLTAAIVENASALKLLGAAGVAAIGFTALAKSIQYVVDESKRLREELDELKQKKTSEQEEVIAGARDVTATARRRREKGFTAEQQAEAETIYEEIMRLGRIRDDLQEVLKNNVAALAGLLEAPDIERLTMAGIAIPPEARPETRERIARAALAKPETQEAVDREREAVRAERERLARAGMREAVSEDPLQGLANFAKLLDRLDITLDPEQVREAIQRYTEELRRIREEPIEHLGAGVHVPISPERMDEVAIQRAARDVQSWWEKLWHGRETGEVVLLRDALERIVAAAERLPQVPPAAAPSGVSVAEVPPGGTSESRPVVINQYNGRYIGSDAASRKRRTVNGESRVRDAERVY